MELNVNNKNASIYRNKNLMLLVTGQIVSNIGNYVFKTSIAWYIMSLLSNKDSGFYMAIFMSCLLVPTLVFGPFSGVIADKFDRKKIIVGTDLIRGTLMLTLASLNYFKLMSLGVLFTITFICAFFETFFNPSVISSVPNLVSKESLSKANSLNSMSWKLSSLIGISLSGFLLHYFGIAGVLLINGISFILSGISEMFIDMPKPKNSQYELNINKIRRDIFNDFKEGLIFLKSQKTLLLLVGFALCINVIYYPVFEIIFPKTIKFNLGMSARMYGILQSFIPIGSIIIMLILSLKNLKGNNSKWIIRGVIIEGGIILALGIPLALYMRSYMSSIYVVGIYAMLAMVLGVIIGLMNIPLISSFHKLVPDEYRGRFFAIFETAAQGSIPVGAFLFGILSDRIQPTTIYFAAGAIIIGLGIWMLRIPEMREL
ncbi:MFS transporter [Wukongibacter baidiensis]|uniref:MFS transporter n=1 Tax=Wukongibacter baidiensis TaxID=1723361 RepID=UPI003D7F735E